MTKDKIKEETRLYLQEFLPEALTRALDSYHRFSEREAPQDDAKAFSAHHTACKVAIAHIELLLKLAKWAELPDQDSENNQSLVKALSDAEENLRHYHEEYPDD
ncbi:MAG: hypothetical protein H6853_04840 [Rhodospirillales bacterium]|nr:hypothetical protein [Alphaproteobacteria bacterium]USO02879.1 MAG: hypothetical protein H6853_04840 [Rhodospirillales bacterium]